MDTIHFFQFSRPQGYTKTEYPKKIQKTTQKQHAATQKQPQTTRKQLKTSLGPETYVS